MKKNLYYQQLRQVVGESGARPGLLCRLRVVLLSAGLLFGVLLSGNVFAQQAPVLTLNMVNVTVDDVLTEIEAKTDYNFFYNTNQINLKRKVTVTVENRDVFAIIDDVFRNTNVTYKVLDKNIVLSVESLKPGAQSTTSTSAAAASSNNVTGRVVDGNGVPLAGATVIVVESGKGITSAADGTFAVSAAKGSTIMASYIGYVSEKVELPSVPVSKLDIVLKEDFQKLDEIVVVGYGVQRRSDLSGAISSVTAEKLNNMPTTSLGEMLRGAAAGVQVSTSSSAPGGGSKIYIRGKRTLSGGDNEPLFVVDGVPMSSIDDLNSNDIASLEVLKDASSQSIYGARAANGVILVTTKRGLSGKMKISYNNYFAVQDVKRNFEFYDGEQWAAMRKEAYYNAYGYYDEEDCFKGLMLDVLKTKQFVDWEDLMIKSAFQQKHDISIQSGNDKTKYALSFGFFGQDGMVINSNFQRVTGRLNVDHKLLKWLTVGTNISYTHSWTKSADGSFNSFITMPPLARVYEDDGVTLRKDVTEAGESHFNPLWNINNASNKSRQERLLVNLFADVKFSDKFSYRLNTSLSRRGTDTNSYLGTEHSTGSNNHGKGSVGTSTSYDYLVENIFNYAQQFGGNDHRLDATLMQSINITTWRKIGLNGTNFPNDDLAFNAIGSANEFGDPSWELSERRLVSFMGRVRYNLFDRYLFSVAMRVDGSSVFGANNKFGYFPSASLAWKISEEQFLDGAKWLSNLKLRVSYGQVGNQGLSSYSSLGLTEKYLTEFGTRKVSGYLPDAALWNPDLKWETSTTANIGVDFGVFNGRINGSIELYDTQTTDLLLNRQLSGTLGYSSQLVNVGELENRGFELTLNTTPISNKDFSWDLNFTYAVNNNKIKKLDGKLDENGKPKDNIVSKWFIGHPKDVYYDYKFDGIWQLNDDIANSHMPSAKPGYVKVANTNGDNVISDADKVIMRRDPKWIGSIATRFAYRNFDVSADLYISYGGTMYNDYLVSFSTGGDLIGKRNGIRRNYWTPKNPSNSAPAPHFVQAPAYLAALGYQDATYIRLRNFTVGYNFSQKMTRKIYIERLRIYATLTNFWTHTDVLGYGPEQNPGSYPEPRTALIGLNVTF